MPKSLRPAHHLLFLLAILLAGVVPGDRAHAQRPNLHHYQAEDGLAQSQVLAIAQDAAGYMWFGNYGGLSRYDGDGFETWTTGEGLPANTVNRLAASGDGRLALATAGGELCVLELDNRGRGDGARPADRDTAPTGSPLPVRLAGAGDLRCRGLGESVQVLDLVFGAGDGRDAGGDGGSTLWAATSAGLYGLDDGRLRRFERTDGLPSDRVQALAVDARGLLVGTDLGLVRRRADPGAGGEVFEPVPPFGDADVRALTLAGDVTYIATADGLARVAGDATTWAPLTADQWLEPRQIAVADDTVWIASYGGVLSWSDGEIQQIDSRRGLPGNVSHTVIIDREGTVWIGTDFGASKLVPGPFLTFGTAEGAPNPIVRAVTEDERGRLWIGTRGGAAYFEDGAFVTVELPALRDPRVYSLAAADGGMWIGTRSGLIFWRDGPRRHLTMADGLPSDYVSALLATPGQLWVGTEAGLLRLRGGELERVRHPLLERSYVMSLHRDTAGRVWVGTQSGGVRRFELSEGGEIMGLRTLDEEAGLSNLTVWSIDEDPEGRVWVGTNGDGAYRVDRDDEVTPFGVEQGLVDNFVWQVAADRDGGVWFYTNRGLDQLEPDGTWRHYDTADGLPDLEGMATAALEDRGGRLWFGTTEGVTRYAPQLRFENSVPPTVRIKELRSQRLGALQRGATIPADAGLLTARYTALSFREEAAVRFRYRLDGGQWSEPIPDRSLSFGSLGPGRYELQIMAANDAGLWSLEPATFPFEIEPAMRHTWPFRLLVLALLLTLGWWAVIFRTRQLEGERRRLGDLVTARTLELEKKNKSLEEQIEQVARAEMERQRLEERLRQSEKMEAVGRLAGGVAHDFNNLLTTISGFGELLSDKLGKGHPQQRDVREILAAAQRAARLTQQLLAFGRKQVIAPKVWGLNALVEELATMLRRLVGEDVELILDLEAPRDTVRCDRGQLEQVILNLAVNARDAMPTGGELTLRTRSEALLHHSFGHLGQEIEPGSYVVLEVIDTGQGIEPGLLEHIFEPFFTTKDTGHGTGLGLATVYGVVQQNDGTVDVDTEPGRGSRFIIRLPHVEESAHQTQTSGTMPLVRVGRQQHSVLVVEDEPTVRRLICGVLRKYGYRVFEADGARQAFEQWRAHRQKIDLLLTDVIMPDTDGRQVADRLTRERADLRVLYVSGYPDDYLGARGILPAKTHFLNKPFTPRGLVKKVRTVLDERPL